MSRRRLLVNPITILSALFLALGQPLTGQAEPAQTTPMQMAPVIDRSGLVFIQNMGQYPPEARFRALGGDYTLWVAQDALWFTITEFEMEPWENASSEVLPTPASTRPSPELPVQEVNLKLSFPRANPSVQLHPFNSRSEKVSYLVGNDPNHWQAKVPVWGGVRYRELFPGVDLEIGSQGSQLQLRLVCHTECHTALQRVRMRVEGSTALQEGIPATIVGDHLRIATVLGEFDLPFFVVEGGTPQGPPAILDIGQGAFDVSSPFSPKSHSQVTTLPQSDSNDLLYSTFLGGSGWDQGQGIAVGAPGNTYVTGYTYSADFPVTPGAFDTTLGLHSDVFVAKLNAASSEVVYATYLGGNYFEGGLGIAVDSDGRATVTGQTHSTDFPTTPNAYDTTCGTDGNCDAGQGIPTDAFVVKLNSDGTDLVYGTYLGGSYSDYGYGVTLDAEGNAYVAGSTVSFDFPTTTGAYDTSWNGNYDIFVVRLNPNGSNLSYATFVGGADKDEAYAIVLDGEWNAYLTGMTRSPDFPASPGAYDPTCGTDGVCNGLNEDAFVLKLNTSGAGLAYATFLGADLFEQGYAIDIDEVGSVYVAGYTVSSGFPTTPGAFDTGYSGTSDAFVTKLVPDGTSLSYSTFLGSAGGEGVFGISVDPMGNVYVTGGTNSDNFPTTLDGFDTTYGGGLCGDFYPVPCSDAFLSVLNPDGSILEYGTYLGDDQWDYGLALAIDEAYAVYLTGQADSGFPTTPGAFDTTHNGSSDAFVSKLSTGVESTMHIADIRLRYRQQAGDRYIVVSLVRIRDQDDLPVSAALVSAEWMLPDGTSKLQGASTNAVGAARFGVISTQVGTYQICVTDVNAQDSVYDPSQNSETCDSLVVP